MDVLEIDRAVIGGYDWGGRGCCVVSALWPERVVALVSGNSYNIQNIARSMEPAPAAAETAYWYQYYFHSFRGRRGLTENRRDLIPALLVPLVAEMGFRRRNLRTERRCLRKSGFR